MTLKWEGKPLQVPIGQQSTVELPPRILRARLTGFLFEPAKTFLLPSAMNGIRQLVFFYHDHPQVNALISGHTDTVGPADYNRGLSMERADAIRLYLTDDADGWKKWYRGGPCSDAWGVREDQYMMSAVQPAFYHGTIDGKLDPDTRDAYTALQNAEGITPANGTPDDRTRTALIRRYMALDNTTLPATAPKPLTHGCGLFHLEVQTGANVDEQRNRRVEVFLFEGPVDPPPRALCPWGGCPEYPIWKQRSIETQNFDDEPGKIALTVVDEAGQPVTGAKVLVDGEATANQDSDAQGAVNFANLPSGIYTARAQKDGFFSPPLNVHVQSKTTQTGQLKIPNVELVVYPAAGDDGDGVEEMNVSVGDQLTLHWRIRGDWTKAELSLDGKTPVGDVSGRTYEMGDVDLGFAPLNLRQDLLQARDGKQVALYTLKVTRKSGSDGPQRVTLTALGQKPAPNQQPFRCAEVDCAVDLGLELLLDK